MLHFHRTSLLCAFCLSLPAFPPTAYAQLCFDIFEDLAEPTLTCADTDYFVDGADGALFFDSFEGADSGLLGADFDGFDLFDPADPELAPPDNLSDPFFSDVLLSSTNIDGEFDSFNARARGSVVMGTRDSRFQQAFFGSRTRTTFTPFTVDGSTDPVDIELDFSFDFTLRDPSDNNTSGQVLAGARALIDDGDPLNPVFDFNGVAQLDLDTDPEPEFFNDFGEIARFGPSMTGIEDEFDIDVAFDTEFPVRPGRELILDTESFGGIFTDGFESGDTSLWTTDSANTFVVSVSSANPNVRFRINFSNDTQDINYGMIGSWYNPRTSGQGFLFDFRSSDQFMFVAEFTFDTTSPQDGGNIPGAEQRWFTAQGNYSGNRAVLTMYQTRNGVFDDPTAVTTVAVGTMIIEFLTCTTAIVTYDLPGFGLSGMIPISKLLADEFCTRIVNGDVILSAAKNSGTSEADTQDINYGMIGSWFNSLTSGQGFLFDFRSTDRFMFVAAFTFDTISPQEGGNISGAEQRWFTAQGNYSGNRAELIIYQTRNGVFDDPAMVTTAAVGTAVVEFTSCTTATFSFDLPAFGLSGSMPITKLLSDEICTLISDGGVVVNR